MDYYKVLDLEKNASANEIKKAYKKKAMQLHPDRNTTGNSEDSEKDFKDLVAAYRVLSNPRLKKQYDMGILSDNEEFNNMFDNMG